MLPLLNSLIGVPLRMALAKMNIAMSERPQGTYTVKNLKPVAGILYKWL